MIFRFSVAYLRSGGEEGKGGTGESLNILNSVNLLHPPTSVGGMSKGCVTTFIDENFFKNFINMRVEISRI